MEANYKNKMSDLLTCVVNHTTDLAEDMKRAMVSGTVAERRAIMGRACISALNKALSDNTTTMERTKQIIADAKTVLRDMRSGSSNRGLSISADSLLVLWDEMEAWMERTRRPLSMASSESKMDWTCKMSSQ